MTLRDELERVIEAGSAFDVWEFIDTHGPALLEALVDAERYRWLQKTNPHRFKKIQDASVIDATDVHYFQKHVFDAQVDQAIDRARGGGE